MQLHGPKRVYTRDSLEFWFGKLEHEWDGYFSEDHLAKGRELYRSGGIREIELHGEEAIVHCRVEKKDEYSVIEWRNGGLHVRSSNPDKDFGRTVAVAGLYEIEELVADEIGELIEAAESAEGNDRGSREGNGRNGNGRSRDEASESLREIAHVHAKPIKRASGTRKERDGAAKGSAGTRSAAGRRPRRQILLRFFTSERGLVCEPWWMENGEAAAPAYPAREGGSGSGQRPAAVAPSVAERMKLISLTALAKKSHFHFEADLGAFLLENVEEIPHFVQNVLPAWERQFKVEKTAVVDHLGAGVASVQVEARARRTAAAGIDLEWIFRSGERLIDEDGVKALAKANGQAVMVPDVGLVRLEPEKLETVRRWREAVGEFRAEHAPAYLLFSLFNDQRFELKLTPELEGWRRRLLQPVEGRLALPEILRPYQRRGVEWLAHLCEHECHGLLADEMGLGKTLQIVMLLKVRGFRSRPSLVVCPASVVPVWQEELKRHAPEIPVHVLKNGHDFTVANAGGVWLASYAQLRNHRELLADNEFGYAILDEGQFIKNPDAKITNTCFEIRARHRIVLTGTPLENRQLDLWSIFNFLLPGLLGTRAAFEQAMAADREETVERLRRQLAPFILRRTKAEVARELPPKVETDLLCPLSDLQRQEYARICREGMERLGDDINKALREKAFGFLSLLTRLRQVCCDPDLLPWLSADLSESGKLMTLAERLGEALSGGHRVVIFSQFVRFLRRVDAMLAERFPEVPRFELTGSTVDRQKPVQAFQQAEGEAVMLVSLKAAGTGITLNAADYVFLLDPWWNPSVEDQAVDRVHRIGQTRTVFVYRLVTAGTIEERIQLLKAEKRQLFDQIIGGVSGDLGLADRFNSLHQLIDLAADDGQPGQGTGASAAR